MGPGDEGEGVDGCCSQCFTTAPGCCTSRDNISATYGPRGPSTRGRGKKAHRFTWEKMADIYFLIDEGNLFMMLGLWF